MTGRHRPAPSFSRSRGHITRRRSPEPQLSLDSRPQGHPTVEPNNHTSSRQDEAPIGLVIDAVLRSVYGQTPVGSARTTLRPSSAVCGQPVVQIGFQPGHFAAPVTNVTVRADRKYRLLHRVDAEAAQRLLMPGTV